MFENPIRPFGRPCLFKVVIGEVSGSMRKGIEYG